MWIPKRAALLLLGIILFIGAVIAGALAAAPPYGSPSHLAGLAISDPSADRLTRLPRAALACTPGPTSDACQITIAGAVLQIEVAYPSAFNFQFQQCTATYAGRTAPCWATTSTTRGPLSAVLAGPALGLPSAALAALRWRYIADTLSEAEWASVTPSVALLAIITAAAARWATRGSWRWRVEVAMVSGSGGLLLAWVVITWALLRTARID